MSKKLNYEINGVKYMLFTPLITEKMADKFEKSVKKHGGIIQSFELKHTWFLRSYLKINVLIPETNALLFSNEKLK